MLVLTRCPQQVIMIGPDVQVIVLDVDGDRVRLGFTAPIECKIRRSELQPLAAPPPPAP
jgi:carbon storage regulator